MFTNKKSIGIETIKQQSGQIEQVSSDYQGRIIYELLQNAFDKADKNILVQIKGKTLQNVDFAGFGFWVSLFG